MKIGFSYLFIAIALEVAGTICIKQSQGFANLQYSTLFILFYVLAFIALNLAVKTISLSIAYATWTGISIVLVAIFGTILFDETFSKMKVLSILMTIAGIIGLNFSEQ